MEQLLIAAASEENIFAFLSPHCCLVCVVDGPYTFSTTMEGDGIDELSGVRKWKQFKVAAPANNSWARKSGSPDEMSDKISVASTLLN